MKNLLKTISIYFFSLNCIHAQFYVKDSYFFISGVSNQGLVVGNLQAGSPYSIWNPDSGTEVFIGGFGPDNGFGGKATFSDDGNFLSGTSSGTLGKELSRYNQSTGEWSAMGSLGFEVDGTYSDGFGISADGNSIVGWSWADTSGGFTNHTTAVAWNPTEGLMDLGSQFGSIGSSAGANSVSADGSVVVGWQGDLYFGPWKSAVWRKNPVGGYFPSEFLLVDPDGDPNDEFNQLGECTMVSPDGKWIGGYSDMANNYEPWIWSEDTGLVNLGLLPSTARGFVTSISADGSMATGWLTATTSAEPPRTPFIWTTTDGLKNLTDYINTDLGISLGDISLESAAYLSSNGKYIAGYGHIQANFEFLTFRVSTLPTSVNNATNPALNITVYPNPFTTQTTLSFSEEQSNTTVEITDVLGKIIKIINFNGKQLRLEKGELQEGIYFLRIMNKQKNVAVQKIVVQ